MSQSSSFLHSTHLSSCIVLQLIILQSILPYAQLFLCLCRSCCEVANKAIACWCQFNDCPPTIVEIGLVQNRMRSGLVRPASKFIKRLSSASQIRWPFWWYTAAHWRPACCHTLLPAIDVSQIAHCCPFSRHLGV